MPFSAPHEYTMGANYLIKNEACVFYCLKCYEDNKDVIDGNW